MSAQPPTTPIRVTLDKDEWYPVYSVVDGDYGVTVEVDAATLEHWDAVHAAFDEVQNEMAKAYREAAQR